MIYVFGLDEGFVMPAGVAMRSLGRFLTRGDEVVVLGLDLTKASLAALHECVPNAAFRAIECSGRIDPSWVPPDWLSRAAFLRFVAADVLSDADRCVYFDGDIVVRRDPAPLAAVDVTDVVLAAVRSRVAPYVASPGGVRRWFPDQEAMNAVLAGKWMELDRSWNYITHVAESFLQQPELEPDDPHIVHFAGRAKPWAWGPMPLYAEEWYGVLASTPWAGFEPGPPPVPTGARAIARRVARRAVRFVRSLLRE